MTSQAITSFFKCERLFPTDNGVQRWQKKGKPGVSQQEFELAKISFSDQSLSFLVILTKSMMPLPTKWAFSFSA